MNYDLELHKQMQRFTQARVDVLKALIQSFKEESAILGKTEYSAEEVLEFIATDLKYKEETNEEFIQKVNNIKLQEDKKNPKN